MARGVTPCTSVTVCVFAVVFLSLTMSQDICDPMGDTQPENFLKISEMAEIDDVIFTVAVFGEDDQVDLKGRYNEYFAFDRNTRHVIVNATLDSDIDSLESQRMYIDCTDKTTTKKVAILIIISITDANDNAPVFTEDVYNVSVGEMTERLDIVRTGAKAIDNDASTQFSLVYYTIKESQYSDYFVISNPLKSDMTLLKRLDYETLPEFTITIIATDYYNQGSIAPGSAGFNTTCQVVIQVFDEDDQYPVFNSSIYRAVISDTSSKDTPIPVNPPIVAFDPDTTLNARVEYSFHGGVFFTASAQDWRTQEPDVGLPGNSDAAGHSGTLFSIDRASGDITLLKKPTVDDVYLLVQATQVDNPSRYGVALLTIHVQGSNVNPPGFTRDRYDVTRTEAFPVGQVITTVLATDKEGNTVTYSLEGNPDVMKIDSNSGDITLLKSLSFERQPMVSVKVIASDGDLTNTADVQIQVYPAANQPPQILTSDLNVTVARIKGAVVLNLEAKDPDIGDTLSFSLLNNNELFSIDANGRISVVAEEEDITLNSYELTVVVADGRQPRFERAAIVIARFPPPEEPKVAAAMALEDDMIPIILGGLAGVFFILLIILLVYVMRNRFKYKEHLDRAKKQYPSQDPKALAFKQKSMGRKTASKMNRIEFRSDELDGSTSVQENPLNANSKGSYFNFGHVHSDTDTEIDPTEIQIETSVAPFDHHRNNNDDNNNDNVYNNSQYSVDSDDYNSIDKNALNTFYRNGSLSTYRESSGSDASLNASPTESADSKKILVPGGSSSTSQSLHNTRIPEEGGGYWEVKDDATVPTISNNLNVDPESGFSNQPAPQKSELTVYF